MIYVFLADGFEEIEALAPVDFLRRAGVEVKLVGVTGKTCVGAHNISVEADILIDEIKLDSALSGVVLPGGMPGFEEYLEGANVLSDGVVTDGNVITAKGAGVAWEFGAAINAKITGETKSDDILRGIQWKK